MLHVLYGALQISRFTPFDGYQLSEFCTEWVLGKVYPFAPHALLNHLSHSEIFSLLPFDFSRLLDHATAQGTFKGHKTRFLIEIFVTRVT